MPDNRLFSHSMYSFGTSAWIFPFFANRYCQDLQNPLKRPFGKDIQNKNAIVRRTNTGVEEKHTPAACLSGRGCVHAAQTDYKIYPGLFFPQGKGHFSTEKGGFSQDFTAFNKNEKGCGKLLRKNCNKKPEPPPWGRLRFFAVFNQKQPCSIMAVAIFLNPAILAPATRS